MPTNGLLKAYWDARGGMTWYLDAGGPGERLRYPTAEMVTTTEAWYQLFEGGRVDVPRNGAAPRITYY